eukprot:CAMPEP_0181339264 /NCGR_PEP_ID=MMETSP1101-20121128/29148_1 /TAXON_ID=46948 /ORGANISM="Rhodomonas abbreviata, Strain Caron Lab Isolate" /LENGTH=274 /DNA_ID=CAMNT_0023450191 /DNA_START=90 /DNA_END=910 /DNA_ORIENTATION=+
MACIDSVIHSLFNDWEPIPDAQDAFMETLPTCPTDQTSKAALSEHRTTEINHPQDTPCLQQPSPRPASTTSSTSSACIHSTHPPAHQQPFDHTMACIDSVIHSLFNDWEPIPDAHDAFLEALPTCPNEQTSKSALSEHHTSSTISRTSSWNISQTSSFLELDDAFRVPPVEQPLSQGTFVELGMSESDVRDWAVDHAVSSNLRVTECAHNKIDVETSSEASNSKDTSASSSLESSSDRGCKLRSARCSQKKKVWTEEEHELFLLGLQKFGNRPA